MAADDEERAALYRTSLLNRAAAEAERAALLTPISQAPALAVAAAWEPIRAWLIERRIRGRSV